MKSDSALLAARALGPALLVGLCRTWRFREIDAEGKRMADRHRIGPGIYALWHAQQLPLTLRHRNENVAVIISQSRDGELITRVVERIGYRAIRGSTTRGGSGALRELTRAGAEGHPLAITTDGPQGPARECKPGAVIAAARTGLPIIPTAAAAVRAWRFNSWDRFMVPKPGSIVYTTYGEPIVIPADVDGAVTAAWQESVTEALNRATSVCEEAARSARRARP